MEAPNGEILWTPPPERAQISNIAVYQRWIEDRLDRRFDCYDDLWKWSVDDPEAFWASIWDYFDVQSSTPYRRVRSDDPMPRTRWFEGAELNLVDHILRHRLATSALMWDSETIGSGEMSWDELRAQAGAFAATLRRLGIQRGDRVVAYLPNIPHTVVAFLAVASVGAIWSICAPEMGPLAVKDRFQQIEPRLLIACDGYRFGGKSFDRRAVVEDLVAALPSLQSIVWVPLLNSDPADSDAGLSSSLSWTDALANDEPLRTEAVPFAHPLWIVYSSGTTGLPKGIVHGHGGILLGGLVSTSLHSNLRRGHRVMWTVSTGWIVWNMHVIGLLAGATLELYEGPVTGPGAEADGGFLWKLIARRRIQSFGAGAAYFAQCFKNDIKPALCGDLSNLEALFSTGSPLTPETYRWIYAHVKPDVWLSAISGGTDIAGAFLTGTPTLPVRLGEMQCRNLGAAVHAFDEAGHAVIDQVGELVCVQPMPSMPLYFWNDPDGSRYIESYFTMYGHEGLTPWRHGDWLRLTRRRGALGGIIYGRSDATINRGGIRMGTAELYRAVEAVPDVLDSLVVDLEYLGRPSYMALFVKLRPEATLNSEREQQLKRVIRDALSPRHVPDEIHQVDGIPRNLAGKKLELPIKKLLLGQPLHSVVNRDAMANPESLQWFVEFARRRA